MRSTVFALFTMEAAHRLENVPEGHKCRRVHGHTYQVRIEVTGDVDPALGWVVDYFEVAEAWRVRVYEKLDHQNLNEVPDLRVLEGNTTSELLAQWIKGQMVAALGKSPVGERRFPFTVHVEVWETATCGARTAT